MVERTVRKSVNSLPDLANVIRPVREFRSLRGRLSRAFSRFFGSRPERLSAPFEGLTLRAEKFRGRGKSGRGSWVGTLEGQPVKVYQSFSLSQAAYIESVSTVPALKPHFPAVLGQWEEYVIAEWVPGHELSRGELLKDRSLLDRVAAIQVAIHQEIPALEPGFSYRDLMLDRVAQHLGPFVNNPMVGSLLEAVTEYVPEGAQVRVHHPDLTPRNLVREGDGAIVAVDNELLSGAWYYSVDLLSTISSLGGTESAAEAYLTAYRQAGGSLDPLIEHASFWRALWDLRVFGAKLGGGDLDGALDFLVLAPSSRNLAGTVIHVVERLQR
jgi:hypothetical protein